jgi:hypothetical protein
MTPKDITFAYKVRHALDKNIANLPASSAERLAIARNLAMSRKKQESRVHAVAPQLAMSGQTRSFSFFTPSTWLKRVGFVIPLAALVLGLMGIHKYEQRQQILEAASIDAEVLTDELPLSAYLDHGFDAYLNKGAE